MHNEDIPFARGRAWAVPVIVTATSDTGTAALGHHTAVVFHGCEDGRYALADEQGRRTVLEVEACSVAEMVEQMADAGRVAGFDVDAEGQALIIPAGPRVLVVAPGEPRPVCNGPVVVVEIPAPASRGTP